MIIVACGNAYHPLRAHTAANIRMTYTKVARWQDPRPQFWLMLLSPPPNWFSPSWAPGAWIEWNHQLKRLVLRCAWWELIHEISEPLWPFPPTGLEKVGELWADDGRELWADDGRWGPFWTSPKLLQVLCKWYKDSWGVLQRMSKARPFGVAMVEGCWRAKRQSSRCVCKLLFPSLPWRLWLWSKLSILIVKGT